MITLYLFLLVIIRYVSLERRIKIHLSLREIPKKNGEICEVVFQAGMSLEGNFASKEMNISVITFLDQIMQCCEGEDDIEFLSRVPNIQNDLDNLHLTNKHM